MSSTLRAENTDSTISTDTAFDGKGESRLPTPPTPADIEAFVKRSAERCEAAYRKNPEAWELIRRSIRDAEEAGRL